MGKTRREKEIVIYVGSHRLTHLVTQTILSGGFIHSNVVTQEFEEQETQGMADKDVRQQ